jgi:hypothetical protein
MRTMRSHDPIIDHFAGTQEYPPSPGLMCPTSVTPTKNQAFSNFMSLTKFDAANLSPSCFCWAAENWFQIREFNLNISLVRFDFVAYD